MMGDINSAVIARLERATQYAAASRLLSGVSGILDLRSSLSSGGATRRPAGGDDENAATVNVQKGSIGDQDV
jgi:hypothetical protein